MSKKILVIRFSAMGDVALSAPVISSVLEQNPTLEIVFLSRQLFKPFFQEHDRLTFIGADLKGKHKGVFGLKKLQNELLKEHKFDAVVDLHDVLRTKILRFYFKARGIRCHSINKGRGEKKGLINGSVPFKKLKHTTQRYLDVFDQANVQSSLNAGPWVSPGTSDSTHAFLKMNNCEVKNNPWIGIAPFAAHRSKEWPIEKMKNVISQLISEGKTVFLFGGGQHEIKKLESIKKEFPKSILVAGQLKLDEELSLISKLDLMVAMDSSNMHLPTIIGTNVVSIWGATHHYLGFGPLNNEHNIIEISKEKLPCRPCSIFGKLKSKKHEICAQKAMELISEEMVLTKITLLLETI
jgi:ADP-heptose:LPS heptosyltransferase